MADKDVHMAGVVSNDTKQARKIIMDSSILDAFPKLANANDSARIEGGVTLLKHLCQQRAEENDSKEFKYALSRLIRGLGSSKTVSKKGYYSTLTAFLTMHPEMCIQTILSTVNHELNPGDSSSKSENADVYMGRILAYGALIRSKLLLETETDIQLQVIQNLIASGKQRSYLSFVSVAFLVEYINQLEFDFMKTTIWPIVENECAKPWDEQTLDTFYLLLIIKDKFPALVSHKFLKKHLGSEDIITIESMDRIVKVLTDLPRILSCHHPIYNIFCDKLISAGIVGEFWSHVDEKFEKPSKTDEFVAIELLKLLIEKSTDKSVLPLLLSPHFVSYILKKLTQPKKQRDSQPIIAGFKHILQLFVSNVSQKDVKNKIKIGVLKKLILHPGELMIEKKTGLKIIQVITGSLNLEGIKKVSKIFQEIVENSLEKQKKHEKMDAFWTNTERIYAAQLLTKLLGHPETVSDHAWRIKQLKLLFTYGFCELPGVGVELAAQFKECFYKALDVKLHKLTDLRSVISTLVHYLDSNLKSKTLILRNPLNEEAEKTWTKVLKLIEKLEKNANKTTVSPVFHIMNLHMGLQLFSDPEMATMSINELQSCYERLLRKPSKQKANNKGNKEDDEPAWVEVVIDLILSLLSRNNHLLRSLVGCVFPHICPYLTPASIHQILAVFDVKNTKGPLVAKADLEDDDEDEDEDNEDDNEDPDDDANSDNDSVNESKEDDETGASSDESDPNSDDESYDEDDTVNDRLRQAVSQALGDASARSDDEDIDVDQIEEEEGKRLDESLAAAFKMLNENRQNRRKKQEKSAQAVMHFRLRVIDLLETYLENSPSMAVVFDMIIPLFVLLEFCIKEPHQTPLQHRVRGCLKQLSSLKKFKDTEGVDAELCTVILTALIEKRERTTSICQEMSDKLAECCTFLVRCAQLADVSTENIVQIFGENLSAFFKKRDCILPPILFRNIFQLQWEGNWKLAPLLVDFAFDSTVRSFRRGHALDFLTTFYNSSRLVHSDTKNINVRTKLEKKLCKNAINMFNELSSAHKDDSKKSNVNTTSDMKKEVKQRYVSLLLNLLRVVYTRHVAEAWNWKQLGEALLEYRNSVSLAKDTKVAYNKLARHLGIQLNRVVPKNTKNNDISKCNGQITQNDDEETTEAEESGSDADESVEERAENSNGLKKKKKRKSKSKEKQQLKKEARLLREQAISGGFEPFQFSSFVLPDENTDEPEVHQNGDAHAESRSNKSQKRPQEQTADGGTKSKRKKQTQQTA